MEVALAEMAGEMQKTQDMHEDAEEDNDFEAVNGAYSLSLMAEAKFSYYLHRRTGLF